jgi:hypothetical protein
MLGSGKIQGWTIGIKGNTAGLGVICRLSGITTDSDVNEGSAS